MAPLTDLADKGAVVTGGASGIGKAIAAALRAAGARVMIADIEAPALARTAAELQVASEVVDVSDAVSVARLAARAARTIGPVHILCNNAGIGPMCRIADLSAADWRWMIDVNLWGVIHGIGSFLPLLRANEEGGHIVNTSSMAGLATAPGVGAYSVTKFGVAALSEALAAESAAEGYGVGVTLLCPGPVRTNLGRSSRNRPAGLDRGALADVDLEDSGQFGQAVPWLAPEIVADMVLNAIRTNSAYVITHPELAAPIRSRHAAIEAAIEAAADHRRSIGCPPADGPAPPR